MTPATAPVQAPRPVRLSPARWLPALAASCRSCNGWGGYYHASKWKVCPSCHGSGNA